MGDSPDNSGSDLPWEEQEKEDDTPSAAELEAAGQSAMFGDAPAEPEKPEPTAEQAPAEQQRSAPNEALHSHDSAPAESAQPYRVLARKYRSQTFAELIGQDAMVQTLANAIKRDRLAHAFLMTGIRGVGKTSTARLIAKALNCVGPDGEGGPTIDPCGQCEPCVAIAEGRHIDVIEMDAASHTGVDDVREIIEAVRYAAVSARYKIYIIDEVHMLSRNAFNALLKTLEEPPAHVKFLFATTEVDKLPITVLSRCQRFDLRRIPAELLRDHYANICEKEGVEAEDEALQMIAAAAEGSARDGLSILDQAIAHADMEEGGAVTSAMVRDMLGLADKGARRALFATILEGDAPALLKAIDDQYALGVEPLALMRSLLDFAAKVTLAQVGDGEPDAPTAEERAALAEWSGKLSPAQLHRLWQLLLKGFDEVKTAPDPLVSTQMALLRVLHAADLPDPGKLADRLKDLATQTPPPAAASAPASNGNGAQAEAATAPTGDVDWAELVDAIDSAGNMHLANRLRMQVRPISVTEGHLVYTQPAEFSEDFGPELRQALRELTGKNWQVEKGTGEGSPTLVEQEQAAKAADEAKMRAHPLVAATFEAFPDAELVEEDDTRRSNVSRLG